MGTQAFLSQKYEIYAVETKNITNCGSPTCGQTNSDLSLPPPLSFSPSNPQANLLIFVEASKINRKEKNWCYSPSSHTNILIEKDKLYSPNIFGQRKVLSVSLYVCANNLWFSDSLPEITVPLLPIPRRFPFAKFSEVQQQYLVIIAASSQLLTLSSLMLEGALFFFHWGFF